MRNSPIGWIGGKRLLRKEILRRIPEHATYVEAFAGAAWVLFGKDPSTSKAEILNDGDGELANFFRCVREKPLELIEKLKFRLVSQEDFRREKRAGAAEPTEIQRAAKFFWRLKCSFGGKMNAKSNFGYAFGERPSFRTERLTQIIASAHDRLKHVYIFREDFETLIDRFDRPETFFYCDPPYYGCESCYEHTFHGSDHERLAARLRAIKGKFLLSYGDCLEIRNLYNWATIETVTTRYSLPKATTKRGTVNELLIRSYGLPTSS